MKKMESAIRWATGCTFFLFSFCILFVCLFSLPKPKTFDIARKLFAVIIKIMGIELHVEGAEQIDLHNTYLMMANHQSLFDLFVIPAAIPLCFTGVEAAYHFSIPIWGYMVKKWGVIPIERHNLTKAIASLDRAKEAIENGMNLCILPEGHRTLTGKMMPFKKGPFHLAKAAKADLLLFGVNGLYDFQSKGRFDLTPGKVVVKIGKPIPYHRVKEMDIDEIRSYCFKEIQRLSGEM